VRTKLLVPFLVLISTLCKGQLFDNFFPEEIRDEISIGAGVSYFTIMGDIGGPKRFDELFHVMKPGCSIGFETRISQSFSLAISAEYGSLASFDRDRPRQYEFKGPVFHTDWNILYHFDNDLILPHEYPVSPYIGLGLGVISFNPRDMNGNLLDTERNYEKFGLTIPFSIGLKYKLNSASFLRYNISFAVTNTDFIDNFSRQINQSDFFSGHKDAFMSTTIGYFYSFKRNSWRGGGRGFSCMERWLSGGWSFLHHIGDIDHSYNLKSNAFLFTFEQRLNYFLGISLQGLFGKISVQNSNPAQFNENLDFQTTLSNGQISLLLYFDNDLIISKNSIVSPYLFVGYGLMHFQPRGDKKDISGYNYYFWSDGQIMSAPQDSAFAKPLIKDEIYETNLDTANLYSKNAKTLNTGIGVRIKLTKSVSLNFQSTLMLTNTDYLDNVSESARISSKLFAKENDAITYNSLSLYVDLRSKSCRRSKNSRRKALF
jgi:hypothetical protein